MPTKKMAAQEGRDRVIIEKIKKLRANWSEAVKMSAGSWREKSGIRATSYVEGLRDALGNKKVDLLITESLKKEDLK